MVDSSQVSQKAQEILDSFMKEMKEMKEIREEQESLISSKYVTTRAVSMRIEGEGEECSEEFRAKFLNNAPNNSQAILANKGSWVK